MQMPNLVNIKYGGRKEQEQTGRKGKIAPNSNNIPIKLTRRYLLSWVEMKIGHSKNKW
jgi:hypothetical protein